MQIVFESSKAYLILILGFIASCVIYLFFFGIPFTDSVSGKEITNETPGGLEDEIDFSWKSYAKNGIEFLYPTSLPYRFINAWNEPPAIKVSDDPYSCDAEDESLDEVIISGSRYCIKTLEEEGGNTVSYEYKTTHLNKTITASFDLKHLKCENFPSSESVLCRKELEEFSPDPIIDGIIQSLKFKDKN